MNKRLFSRIRFPFSFLIEERSFVKTREVFDLKDFGNELVVLESTDFRIRFIKDRGDLLIDLGPSPALGGDAWYALQDVLGLVDQSVEDQTKDEIEWLNGLAVRLKSNYTRIKELFEEANYLKTKAGLDKIQKARLEHWRKGFQEKKS